MKDPILPQLARPYYTIDCDDEDDSNDDSSSASLEILPPTRRENNNNKDSKLQQQDEACQDKKMPKIEAKPAIQDCPTDSDDDDEFLLGAKPIFAATTSLEPSQSILVETKPPTRKRPLSNPSITTKISTVASSISSSATLSQPSPKDDDESRPPPPRPLIRKNGTSKHPRVATTTTTITITAEQRKRQEHLARQIRRNQEKEARLRQKETEKKTKQQEKLQTQQAMGKFAHQEIVILVDPILTRSNEYGIVTCLEETFSIQEFASPCQYQKLIQWIRKDYIEGGAQSAWQSLSQGTLDGLEHLHHVIVIMDYTDLIPLIERIEEDEVDDYPKLLQWLTSLKHQWQVAWSTTKEPRITLMLHRVIEDLEGEWNKQQRKGNQRSGGTVPSDWELRDALQWILVQYQVDCIHCTSHEEVQVNLHLFTRALAEAPYSAQATELECVRKIKPAANLGEDDLSKVQDTWARQLQMIPRVSEPRARNLVQHYPTLQSLWQAYQQGNENSNRNLLNNCFGNQNAQASLSATVYKVMTCQDPQELV